MKQLVMFITAYITIDIVWQIIELLLYGHTKPSITDAIIAAELALIVVIRGL